MAAAPQTVQLHIMQCSAPLCQHKWLELSLARGSADGKADGPAEHCGVPPITGGTVTVQVLPNYRI